MTPEGKVKEDCHAVFHKYGLIRAGSPEAKWPEKPYGWYYMPVQVGMGVNGIPDFVCCLFGFFFAVETKAPGKLGNLSPNQARRHSEIIAGSGRVFTVDSAEMLEAKIEEWFR